VAIGHVQKFFCIKTKIYFKYKTVKHVVCAGEHSLFCIDSSGKLEFVKKFEDTLSCVKSFPEPQGSHLMTIACTHSKQLLVFEDACLKWAAKLDDVPVDVQLGSFG